ncbi:putative ribonuclease H-like domain-containing protein [Tanacetum coccineum]|uniref:Ribonuclease H-like domain-containing protein n=1 Tax=Tanacetum coccineum TaxID=301880 RepID=A0ABQ5GJY1_9ASTR
MEFETTQNNALTKLPLLKLGDYEMWEMIIKQYFRVLDYSLWDIIENGNSWVPRPVTTTTEGGASTTKIVYKDAQSMFIEIKARLGGNEATKKTQKALLKQQYENFSATSSESLDSIFNRLQKLVSILEILGVVVPPEDLNLKFLKSLPAEWDTHVVVWMNKPDFDTMRLDDLYNNFKIVEQKIKKYSGSSIGDKNLAFVTSSGTSSTINTNTAVPEVSTASTKVNTASTTITTATLSDATVYAFLASQPKGSQLFHEDLDQLHDDDLEEMDLKWNMALLSMKARKFYQRTGRKINIDGSNTAGYDKSKVECFNCHKLGHFARECRSPKSRSNNQEPTRKPVIIEDTTEKAMMALDGVGIDWSDMAEGQVQNNMALMAFSDSEVYSDKSCSKSCLKNHEALKKQFDDLLVKLNDSDFKIATYKKGLATLENQIITYKKNEVCFSEEVVVLKREVGFKEYELGVVKAELERVKQEKDGIDFKIKGFDKSTKDLDAMLESQRTDKNKQGLGYNAVAPPHPIILNSPTKLDLSYSCLDEFKEPELNRNAPRDSVLKPTIVCDKESDNSDENTDDSLEKGQASDNETSLVESPLQFDKDWKEKFFYPENHVESVKSKNKEKLVKRTVRYAKMYRSHSPRGNQRNWNGQKSNQLEEEFVMYNKSCFNCGSFEHMKLNCPFNREEFQRKRMGSENNYNRVDYDYYARSNTHKQMVPRAVLLRNGLKTFNTARPSYTAHPRPTVHSARPQSSFTNQAQSTVQRPFYKKTVLTNRFYNQNFNTVRSRFNTARPYVNTARANGFNAVKPSVCWVWRPTRPNGASLVFNRYNFIDARGRSKSVMAWEFDGGNVTFGGGAIGGRISGKGTLKTNNIDFDDVYFLKELNYNLFSVSQMCDKKNYVLFTDTECLVLSPNFKLPDENQVLLKIPREDNMYSFNMRNIVPKDSLTCLAAKATLDESMLWHRRLGKQHRASCKSKVVNPITKPLFMLYMDLFGHTFVSSLMHKKYCLVITDDFSRFTWVFFLNTKDETSNILMNLIKEIENQVDKKVKVIRSDNGTEFKNKVLDEFCREKGIRREYSVARTPQQNGVAERRNRTLIEAARTMLADSKLPTKFWAEAVSTACYVHNRVLIVKPHNKTPYELFRGFKPAINFMKPFGCHVTILNTLDHLGKFDGKSDEGYFVGYSLSSKAFRVYNTRTRKVEENLHVGFLENKPMIEGTGPSWLFDIDSLTQSMNYVPVTAGTNTNVSAGTQGELNAGTSIGVDGSSQDCIIMPIWKDTTYFNSKHVSIKDLKTVSPDQEHGDDGHNDENDDQDKSIPDSSPKEVNSADSQVNTASPKVDTGSPTLNIAESPLNTADSKDKSRSSSPSQDTHLDYYNDEDEPEVELGNIPDSYAVPTTPHTRIQKDHPSKNVIGDLQSSMQTRRMLNPNSEQGFIEPNRVSKALSDPTWVEAMQEELLQFELQKVWILVDLPKGNRPIGLKWIFKNKTDERGIIIRNKARLVAQGHTQEEGIDYDDVFAPVARIEAIKLFLAYASFMGFMVYQMDGKSAFLYGTIEEEVYVCQPLGFEDPEFPNKVYKVVKALYGLHQAPRAWYETLANYLLSNGFHRGKIDPTLFIKRHKGDILLVQVYVDDIIFGSTKKEMCDDFEKLMKDKFQMSSMGELTFFLGLQVKQKKDGIFISQDKYVAEILRKFNYTDVKSASTTIDLEKPFTKDGDAEDVDVHLYRSMIGSLMYLTASRPDIMFAVCVCARFQVTPKTSLLTAVKRIFRYLKGKPTLGLWYARDSPFELVAYTDSDYAGATQDRKSTTGGCQFLGSRLISWQCKKQTIVATSTTEDEYVAAASCCGQVLWIQNQLLDYGYNFMNTLIYIDNTSTICIIENPVKHHNTKHIAIRYHFIRDCNAKKLIRMAKVHTDHNVANLLTKGFDAGSCLLNFLLMADLEFYPKHNMVAFLEKPAGSEGFHQIIDFLSRSHIHYALTRKPDVFISLIKQFWSSAKATTADDGEVIITATIDGQVKTITKASLRIHLKLKDHDGVETLPNTEIFEQLAPMGYHTDSDRLTFQKGVEVALFPDMLNVPTPASSPAPSSSPSRITSSPSSSTEPSSEPPTTQPSPDADAHVPIPHDPPLHVVHSHESEEGSMQLSELTDLVTKLTSRVEVLEKGQQALETELHNTRQTYSAALTKLILKFKKLESKIKRGRARTRARHVLSEEEIDSQDDSSKQGRNISDSEKDQDTVLIDDNEVEWIQEEVEVQEKVSNDTELVVQDDTPTEVIKDKGSGEKGEKEVSTAEILDTTAELPVNTAREFRSTVGRIVYTRRTEQIRKDKGKAIMIEPEPIKKSKKLEEQERFGFEAAIRLQEQEDAEKRMQIARDEEIARQWDEEERKRLDSETKTSKEIDWSDPSVQRYWELKNKPKTEAQARQNMITYLKNQSNYKAKDFKGMSYDEIRPIFERVRKFNQDFLAKKPEEVQEQEVVTETPEKEVSKKTGGKKKKLLARKRSTDAKDKETSKRQKVDTKEATDYEKEKEELRMWLLVVPNEEEVLNPEILHTRYPIVDWESQSLGDMHVYKIIRADGDTNYHKTFESIVNRFDRKDLEDLHRLVMDRFKDKTPEGYKLILWGDLKTLFDPVETYEVWSDRPERKLLKWKLHEFSGIHTLSLREDPMELYMFVEKKYPMSKDILKKMLKLQLEAEEESTMGLELIKFVKSQIEE